MDDRMGALETIVATACLEIGIDLVDFDVHDDTVEVIVERSDGLDLDVIAEVSRLVSDVLDDNEQLAPPGRYELEVSSPGLERRLRRPAHFVRAIGATVSLRTVPGSTGPRRIDGLLAGADDDAVVIEGGEGERRRVEYSAIDRAHTVFDWKAALAQDNVARRRAAPDRPGATPVLQKEGRS